MWNSEWKLPTKLLTAWFYGVFAWGIIFYIDAPIKPCDNGHFCGKSHKHYTEQQYVGFERWQTTLFVTGFFLVMFRLVEYGFKKDRERLAEEAKAERTNVV
jgi:hypothetical protein